MHSTNFLPGFRAPAALSILLLAASPAIARQAAAPAPVQQPVSSQPVPGDLELAKLVWTTMAAVDHANLSGNYSVLRDLASPGFQLNNDAARLGQIFASLRATRVDLSNTLLLAPTYARPATIVEPGVMRVQGYFGLRPTAISFDLHYQWVGGRWRLFGVSIGPRAIASEQPGAPTAPAARTPVSRR